MKTFSYKIYNLIKARTVPQKIFRFYFLMIFFAAILLFLPISYVDKDNKISFIDALFTAVSALADTGLTVKNTGEYFSFFGQLVILLLFQIGGIGYMGLKVILLISLGRKIGLRDKLLISTEKGNVKLGGSKELIVTAIKVVFIVELLIAILMGFNFFIRYYNDINSDYYHNFANIIWHSIFHSISAVNNAGFDLFGSNSLSFFVKDYFMQFLVLIGFIIGGIGFPVFYDIRNYFLTRKKGEFFRFSLFSKLALKVYFFIFFSAIIVVTITELTYSQSILYSNEYSLLDKIFIIIFNTSSTRNAGFSTIDINLLSDATKNVYIFLMWIGASPVSTGGGIRTTTFWIAVLSTFAIAVGKNNISTHGKKIPLLTAIKSLVVVIVSIFLLFFSFTLIVVVNKNAAISNFAYIFELVSAFGTTGLSFGITKLLSSFDKVIFIIVMIIGQLGVSSTLLIFSDFKESINQINLPEEDISIG